MRRSEVTILSGTALKGLSSCPLVAVILLFLSCSTICSANDIFTRKGFHRNIPQYVNGKVCPVNLLSDDLELLERLRSERQAGDREKVIATLSTIGASLDHDNDFYKAERYHTEALEIAKKACPPDSPILAGAYHNIGANQEFQKRYYDGIFSYNHATQIWHDQKPADVANNALATFGMARCLQGNKDYRVAIAAYKNALKFATAAGAHELRAEILTDFTNLLDHLHDPELEKYLKESVEASRKIPPMKYQFIPMKPKPDK